MQHNAQISLSALLKNMADQFRAFDVCEGSVIIEGQALTNLVSSLDLAADAAARLEGAGARVIPFPRRGSFGAWRPAPRGGTETPPARGGDDGGDAA